MFQGRSAKLDTDSSVPPTIVKSVLLKMRRSVRLNTWSVVTSRNRNVARYKRPSWRPWPTTCVRLSSGTSAMITHRRSAIVCGSPWKRSATSWLIPMQGWEYPKRLSSTIDGNRKIDQLVTMSQVSYVKRKMTCLLVSWYDFQDINVVFVGIGRKYLLKIT